MAIIIDGRGQWGIRPKPSDFVSTWKTNNAGVSTSTQIKLPLVSTGTYNFVVDWGDGTTSTITTWNAAATTHTYATAGTYTVKIKGICTGWQFNTGGDRLKILSVSSWGKLKLGTTEGSYFYGCSNLNLSGVTDVLDLAGTTNLANCFFNCTSLTTIGRLNEWDVSSVTSMSWMFRGTNFNQNIGSWNTSSVTTMFGMFRDTLKFNNGLALGVAGTLSWNTGAVTNMSEMFSGAIAFNCNVGSWNVSLVSNFNGMFQAEKFNNGGSSDINNWTLKTTGTVNMGGMFQSATIFNQPLNGWNTVAVTAMQYMFYFASAFNNGLASGVAGTLAWNTSAVTNMLGMFLNVSAFNCNVGSWNVSNVTDFTAMFQAASKFNNGGSDTIGNWTLKTTGPISMYYMFGSCVLFNQPLNGWNMVAVTNMSAMLSNCSVFNNGLPPGAAGTLVWNTSNVTNMAFSLSSASFNCDVSSWDVSKVTDFSLMFNNALNFNNGGSPNINNWVIKTTGTVNMNRMFISSTIFNQPIGSWNTVAVTNMYQMFYGANAFNQDLSSWDTTNVTDMTETFRNATAFDQNIGSWNVSKVTNFTNFMLGKTLSTFSATNLDAIYNGWSTRPVLPNKSISFGGAKRTTASDAGRLILTNPPNLWTITDGGI
jgi:surface protein